MDAFEHALDIPDIILFDENIFTVIEYSLIDLQNENVIYFNIFKIGKKYKI